ncbi:MAG: hypothetical protein ACREJ5_28360, partial [Geminicoccaceae bacterium]
MSKLPAIVLLGPGGLEAARRIAQAVPGAELFGPSGLLGAESEIVPYDALGPTLRDLFAAGRPIIALCASGIVIRILAPLIQEKGSEPPVVVVAEDGSVVVP